MPLHEDTCHKNLQADVLHHNASHARIHGFVCVAKPKEQVTSPDELQKTISTGMERRHAESPRMLRMKDHGKHQVRHEHPPVSLS